MSLQAYGTHGDTRSVQGSTQGLPWEVRFLALVGGLSEGRQGLINSCMLHPIRATGGSSGRVFETVQK